MACRDVWNTWPSGLRSPQNPPASPSGFVVTGGPRAMYFTHHGKPWLKPITESSNCLKGTRGHRNYCYENNRNEFNPCGRACSKKTVYVKTFFIIVITTFSMYECRTIPACIFQCHPLVISMSLVSANCWTSIRFAYDLGATTLM